MISCELKLYRGYANKNELVICGHAFKKYPRSENLYNRKGFKNIRSIIQLFTVKTIPNIKVVFEFGDIRAETYTEEDGFFRFQLPLTVPLPGGWYPCTVTLDDSREGEVDKLTRAGEFLVPDKSALLLISDIDDTFLVSYSLRPLKKLYVMLTKNVESRKSYANVVRHYQLLETAGGNGLDGNGQLVKNPFFYVSSSEWNLYDYIVRFTQLSGLPKAVIKLRKIKDNLNDFLTTGRGQHNHKLRKIARILRFYPEWKYILLGDDSQRDPFIYHAVVSQFPATVRAVYIRQTGRSRKRTTEVLLSELESRGVVVCYFRNSREAIQHSVREGIISEKQLAESGHS